MGWGWGWLGLAAAVQKGAGGWRCQALRWRVRRQRACPASARISYNAVLAGKSRQSRQGRLKWQETHFKGLDRDGLVLAPHLAVPAGAGRPRESAPG